MPITLTSCTRVRDPGFSSSECLELAKRIERGGWTDYCGGCGETIISRESRNGDIALIVAALRAFASE